MAATVADVIGQPCHVDDAPSPSNSHISSASSPPPYSPSSSSSSSPTKKQRHRVPRDDPARMARLAARQVRNRQSAQNSRDRKRAEQVALEAEVAQLRQQKAEFDCALAGKDKTISTLMDLIKDARSGNVRHS